VIKDVFEPVEEIANSLSPDRWMFVGGLMAHAHAQLAGTQHRRPTDDADLVVKVRAWSYAEAAARPVLVLTREVVRPHLSRVTVAPMPSSIRGLSTEVRKGSYRRAAQSPGRGYGRSKPDEGPSPRSWLEPQP